MRPGAIARLARLRSAEVRTAGREAAALDSEARRARGAADAIGARVADGRRWAATRVEPAVGCAADLLVAAAWRGGCDREGRRAAEEERRATAEAARARARAEEARSAAARLLGRAGALDRVADRIAGDERRAREARREREVEEARGAG